MSRKTAIQAAAKALTNQATPEIWRSYEALAEAAIDAALPHLKTAPARQEELQPQLAL